MADRLIGSTIGEYEILSQIGQGGMATVYLARQQSMNRQVAVKVLPRQYLNDDTYLQRFYREVEIISQLEHRNIVPVYTHGEHDTQPYIVMRYMPFGSVDDLLRSGAIDAEMMLSIISQIAPALDYAHGKDILHRDLKPSNILMDDDGGAYITDFGIARIVGHQGPAITTQGVVGTPSYMSPEQAQAKAMDGRSDIYSLAVMLFEMATGRRPFESETPYSIAVMQVTESPPSPRSLNTDVTSAIERVILKGLQKDPEQRFATATELATALKLAVERPTSTHDTEPNLRPPKPEPVVQQPQSAPPSRGAPTPQSSRQVQPVYDPGFRTRIRERRQSRPLVSLAVGSALGCGLLLVVFVIGALLLSSLANSANTAIRTTLSPDVTAEPEETQPVSTPLLTEVQTNGSQQPPPLDETSDAARQTLVARANDADATITVIAQQTSAAPTRTRLPELAPVGSRGGTPTLRPALRGATGKLVYFDKRIDEDENETFEIITLDLDTWTETQLTLDLSDNTYPQPSPDGRWIVFQSDRDNDFDIYVMNIVGGQLQKLTFNDHWDRLPAWSPDGEWIIYSSDVRGDQTFDLYKMRLDGSENQPILSNGMRNSHARWLDDRIVFTSGSAPRNAGTWEIASLDAGAEEPEVILLTENTYRDSSPVLRPDGEQIAFVTLDGNDLDIAVMDADGRNRQILYGSEYHDWAVSYNLDGRFLVVTSTIDENDQLFLIRSDGSGAQQITTNGGAYASWIPEIGDE